MSDKTGVEWTDATWMVDDEADCTCTHYVVDYSDPDRNHPSNMDREDDPACRAHHPIAQAIVTYHGYGGAA